MLARSSPLAKALAATLALSASAAACGNSSRTTGTAGVGGAATTATGSGGSPSTTSASASGTGGTGGQPVGPLGVEPSILQTLPVTLGATPPTVTYTATLGSQPAGAALWSVDKANVATIAPSPGSTAVLTPSGTAGGLVTVQVSAGGQSAKRQVLVKLSASQNGPNASTAEMGQIVANTPAGAASLTMGGGIGGVGGEGLGGAVTDALTLTALGTPTSNGQAQGLKLLYPYDQTVFPRGIAAPLLMWDWSVGDADAVQIQIQSTTGSFSWTGTFGRPPVLVQTGGKLIRMPIPEDVWEMATNTAGGTSDQLMVSLTVASGGVGYGPITETWTVASARLAGVIYYTSYGTALAKNSLGALGGDGTFGAAVVSIHAGDLGPQLVAGAAGDASQCRSCHSVAAGGSRLVAQHGDDYATSSAYDLTPSGATEDALANGAAQGYPGVFPDGSLALDEYGQILPLPVDTTPITPPGLSAVSNIDVGTPTFAVNGKLAALNPFVSATLGNVSQQLFVMSFAAATSTFGDPVIVSDDTGQPEDTRPGWPAFFPDNSSVVFHHQTASSVDGSDADKLATRAGALAQIYWTNLTDAQHVTPLDQLNGLGASSTSYLPTFPGGKSTSCLTDSNVQVGNIAPDHSEDVNHNYEPTVGPVASGGYAWVVFTSRRLYGSVANMPPFCSDPRGVDLVKNVTTKKLWVAAVDLGATPGADASHPAFYLPAQELLAANSRGVWVRDPCRAAGASCQSGDQCCGGYCEPSGTSTAPVCSTTPSSSTCSAPMERCAAAADCCDASNACVGGWCAQVGVTQ